MKALFEQVEIGPSHSVKVKQYRIPVFDIPYHFHPEVEITLVESSRGKVFVSDSVTDFEPGDLFIFGVNVPHIFVNHKGHSPADAAVVVTVIQFPDDLISRLAYFPEFKQIEDFIRFSSGGIKVGQAPASLVQAMGETLRAGGITRFSHVLMLLHQLSQLPYPEPIDKSGNHPVRGGMPERFRSVSRYILSHYHRDISLDEVASVASMNKSAFCRYFKEHARKTFSEYLNELRIDYASKLVLEGSLSISQICFEVGYNNLPYFIKQFKKIKGASPRQYQAQHRLDR
jgi:AraC-like DNA-binding protein